jgi:hypothetical protein
MGFGPEFFSSLSSHIHFARLVPTAEQACGKKPDVAEKRSLRG